MLREIDWLSWLSASTSGSVSLRPTSVERLCAASCRSATRAYAGRRAASPLTHTVFSAP
jgi:hypothetical protein